MDAISDEGIDASTFQKPLADLAKTMTHLVERAAANEHGLPSFVADDVAVLLRLSFSVYGHLCFLYHSTYEALEPHCLPEYGFVTLPQIRILIDCLYNTVVLLEQPAKMGRAFRADGYRQLFASIDEASQVITASEDAKCYLNDMRKHYELSQRVDAISDEEIEKGSWPTFSAYVKTNGSDNAMFLKRFSFGPWKQYSAISHGTFWGLTHIAPFLRRDRQLPENRAAFLLAGMKPLSVHLLRASYVFLCMLTEVEARLSLGDHARVKPRLKQIWTALANPTGDIHAEAKQVFESRYARILSII